MSRRNTQSRSIPLEAHEIIQSELGGWSPSHDPTGPHSAAYELDPPLGPFDDVEYTTEQDGHPSSENHLIWMTEPQGLYGIEPEEVIHIGEKVIEVRDAMAKLGYSFDPYIGAELGDYAAQLGKEVEEEALSDEISKVKDKFGDWKW